MSAKPSLSAVLKRAAQGSAGAAPDSRISAEIAVSVPQKPPSPAEMVAQPAAPAPVSAMPSNDFPRPTSPDAKAGNFPIDAADPVAIESKTLESENSGEPPKRVLPSFSPSDGRTKHPSAAARAGKRPLSVWIAPEAKRTLRQLAGEEDRTIESLVAESLNDLFQKYRKPRLA